jgi:signal transduction histidine kinase
MASEPFNEALVRHLRDFVPLLVVDLDAGGIVRDLNAYARVVLGDRLVGRPFSEVVVDFVGGFDLAALLTPSEGVYKIDLVTASLAPETYFVRGLVNGSTTVLVGHPDFAGTERLRDEVLGLNRQLSTLGRQVQKANAELRELNELKTRFLGMAAHDLRRPIGAVITYTEFVRDEAGEAMDPEHVGFLDTVLTIALGMKRLVDDFLDVAVIESGKLRLQIGRVSVEQVIQPAIDLARLAGHRKSIEVVTDRIDGDILVEVDAERLQQVLVNLLGNAVEHSPPGGRVTLDARCDGDRLVLAVSDQGNGLTADQQARLFAPFGVVGTQKTAAERSTGLGLVIARKIVDAHGGGLRVESEAGAGATFVVEVPVSHGLREGPAPGSSPPQ